MFFFSKSIVDWSTQSVCVKVKVQLCIETKQQYTMT